MEVHGSETPFETKQRLKGLKEVTWKTINWFAEEYILKRRSQVCKGGRKGDKIPFSFQKSV